MKENLQICYYGCQDGCPTMQSCPALQCIESSWHLVWYNTQLIKYQSLLNSLISTANSKSISLLRRDNELSHKWEKTGYLKDSPSFSLCWMWGVKKDITLLWASVFSSVKPKSYPLAKSGGDYDEGDYAFRNPKKVLLNVLNRREKYS